MGLSTKSGKKRRATKPDLNTKDFNEIVLRSALLKEDFEGSSNPKSMHTMDTGLRSLNERAFQSLSGSVSNGACSVATKKSSETRQKCGSKFNFRSQGGSSSHRGSLDRSSSASRPDSCSIFGIKETLRQ